MKKILKEKRNNKEINRIHFFLGRRESIRQEITMSINQKSPQLQLQFWPLPYFDT